MAFSSMKQIHTVLSSLLLLLVFGTAQANPGQVTEVEPGSSLVSTALSIEVQKQVSAIEAQPDAESLDESGSTIGISAALEFALANHPGIAALDKEYWALDSIAWQEGRKPNPGLELEFGDFGGTADNTGIRALGTSLTYSQSFERGGKRTKREVAASLEREVILWDIAELEHEIQASVRTAFAAAQAAQYETQQLRKYRSLVQRICDVVAASVEAGRSARLELERFQLELARLDLELEIAGRNQSQTYLELANTWGDTSVDFAAVQEVQAGRDRVPSIEKLLPLLSEHPAYSRYDAEYQALCALVDLENANAVPDFELFGGLTRLNETDETVFNVGVAWDLTTHHKNEGNISSAGYMLEQVADNQALAMLELETELSGLHHFAGNALLNYQAYGDSLIPAANNAMALTEEGFRFGKFELMDVLDAQRIVLELESEQTAALMEFHILLAQIEALLDVNFAEQLNLEITTENTSNIELEATSLSTSEENDNE